MAELVDPLVVLPVEIILQILEYAPVSAVLSLSGVSKAWNSFESRYQDAIYSSPSKVALPPGARRDPSWFQSNSESIAKYFDGTASWKDLCKRQTRLERNWGEAYPTGSESFLQVGNDPIWRFRPDFKRRFFISTSQTGGLNVTCMDSGRLLWRLPSTLGNHEHAVRPYAHLEYQDGMAVFDSDGNTLEVWQTDQEDDPRGVFRQVALLDHPCQTRGFQLSHWTLCVVSNQGQGFVYDMTQRPPKLTTNIRIENGAVGHLDQSEDTVMFSMGKRGYHAYNKVSGEFIGALQPSNCSERYHIHHPDVSHPSPESLMAVASPGLAAPAVRLGARLPTEPLEIDKGPLPPMSPRERALVGENTWGAGMLHGDLFAGYSRGGLVFVCSNWRKALESQADLTANSYILECESDWSRIRFDFGGWLSVHNHRIMFEIRERIYVIALDANNRVQDSRASYSVVASEIPECDLPVSYMTLCDDAIMTTYTVCQVVSAYVLFCVLISSVCRSSAIEKRCQNAVEALSLSIALLYCRRKRSAYLIWHQRISRPGMRFTVKIHLRHGMVCGIMESSARMR